MFVQLLAGLLALSSELCEHAQLNNDESDKHSLFELKHNVF